MRGIFSFHGFMVRAFSFSSLLLAAVFLTAWPTDSYATPPNTPANLKVTQDGDTLTVSWDSVANALQYFLSFKTIDTQDVPSGEGTLLLAGATNTEYKFKPILPGFTYSFKIVADNAGGKSNPSGEISHTTNPNKPAWVKATKNDKGVEIKWEAVPGADSYTIYYSTTETVKTSTMERIANIKTSNYNHSTVPPASNVYYGVVAVEKEHESEITIPPAPVSPEPTGNLDYTFLAGVEYSNSKGKFSEATSYYEISVNSLWSDKTIWAGWPNMPTSDTEFNSKYHITDGFVNLKFYKINAPTQETTGGTTPKTSDQYAINGTIGIDHRFFVIPGVNNYHPTMFLGLIAKGGVLSPQDSGNAKIYLYRSGGIRFGAYDEELKEASLNNYRLKAYVDVAAALYENLGGTNTKLAVDGYLFLWEDHVFLSFGGIFGSPFANNTSESPDDFTIRAGLKLEVSKVVEGVLGAIKH